MGRDRQLHSRTNKERYQWYKARGICISCGASWSEPGRVRCKVCHDKHERSRDRVAQIEMERRNRAAWREAGLCTVCGKRQADDGRRTCAHCRAVAVDRDRKYRILRRMDKEADEARRRGMNGTARIGDTHSG